MTARTHPERAENVYAHGIFGLRRECLVPAMRVTKAARGDWIYSQQVLERTIF
jgi:hypothetical protein